MLTRFHPNKIDLFLSAILAIIFPFLAGLVFQFVGALLPMVLYYGLAWGIVKWRRGSTGYFNQFKNKIPISFVLNIIIILSSIIFAFFGRLTHSFNYLEMLLTAFIWAPINAASEQLLWIYIFESWDFYFTNNDKNDEDTKNKKILFRIIGLILFTLFVGTIHTFFWTLFLHVVDPTTIFGIIFVLLTTISGFLHIIVWRQSNQMVLTFIPHFILNFIPIFFTGYSIIIFLFP
ncbi:MAG: hypothetical protein EU547_03640 [Promethearchaeota archaeon]|nr:MAG: hypothetical protein EU547_03640 [Candidatus Lokiarchaeota archaeon]